MHTDTMTPIEFEKLLTRILDEYRCEKTIFGIRKIFKANENNKLSLFGEKLETPFGPAAGPHTQLAQNIVSSYICGSRFFELKTVQVLDGEDLPVSKPCITAGDEAYNCEWSTELYVPQAFDEYVKAWFILHILAKEFEFGSQDGFIFNMSVGYDLDGIKTEKINTFIEGLKSASDSHIYNECYKICLELIEKKVLTKFTKFDLQSIRSSICNSITLSTLHGCPPDEIERIATYLLTEKKLNTFIKCNPTLLGYDFARKTLDELGFDYIAFDDHHFKEDLQLADAIPMLERLQKLANAKSLEFGVKITNTFPVDVKKNELPSEEMYMSGRSLAPLSLNVACLLSEATNGSLRISYSGGADILNIKDIYNVGIWPITIATSVLKPGGYERFTQIANTIETVDYRDFSGIDVTKLKELALDATKGNSISNSSKGMYKKSIKPIKTRKSNDKVPLFDCFTASCANTCPINQDIPAYIRLNGEENYEKALEVILDKNPLPFITGTICSHPCMLKCTRNFYDSSVNIRGEKLKAAENAFSSILKNIEKKSKSIKKDKKIKLAIIGAGPAGLSAAYFAKKQGISTTIFEKKETCGGIVQYVIPNFRIPRESIQKDISIIEAMGVTIKTNSTISNIEELKKKGFTHIIVAIGAWGKANLDLGTYSAIDALDFLADFKEVETSSKDYSSLLEKYGDEIIIIGGGNTAMDTARAAKRITGVKNVKLVYRRTKKYMPADEEELELALQDGVEFCELLSPLNYDKGILACKKMKLGAYDNSGRRSVVETNDIFEIKATSVIAATGSTLDNDFYTSNKINCDLKGYPNSNQGFGSFETVYIIGDGAKGPSTVVESIASAQKAIDAILDSKKVPVFKELNINTSIAIPLNKKGILDTYTTSLKESDKCLECSTICELCCDVCPNRANIAILLESKRQIVHIDSYCNECGNCSIFCPYSSDPYKDKITLFATKEAFEISTNSGFFIENENLVFVRINTEIIQSTLNDTYSNSDLNTALKLAKDIWYNKKYLI